MHEWTLKFQNHKESSSSASGNQQFLKRKCSDRIRNHTCGVGYLYDDAREQTPSELRFVMQEGKDNVIESCYGNFLKQ